MNTDEFEQDMKKGQIGRKHCEWMLAEVKRLRETYNLATCQSCTCNGDGIAGSAYEGHIYKCVCVEEEEVKRLRADYEVIYQAKMELEFETLEQQVLICKLQDILDKLDYDGRYDGEGEE